MPTFRTHPGLTVLCYSLRKALEASEKIRKLSFGRDAGAFSRAPPTAKPPPQEPEDRPPDHGALGLDFEAPVQFSARSAQAIRTRVFVPNRAAALARTASRHGLSASGRVTRR